MYLFLCILNKRLKISRQYLDKNLCRYLYCYLDKSKNDDLNLNLDNSS